MRRHVVVCAAAAASLVMCSGVVLAQDAGGTTTPPANPPAATTPPVATPPAATTPANPPGAGQKLPDVEVIQQQPKPKAKPVKQANKPKKKPVVVEAPPPVAPVSEPTAEPVTTDVKMSPIGGSEIPIAKVPGGVSTVSAQDIASTGSVVPQDFLAQHVPGITVTDLQGNGFQTDIQYRGFEASPVNGVAQGIAVYQNGVRINEAFGDTINLDFLPEMAIENVTVMSGNPVYGLNALGGAISFDMKDGFNYHGTEIDLRGGSFGWFQQSAQTGMQSGPVAVYMAIENVDDNGWREFSPTYIDRMYADLGFKGTDSEFHINFTGADNKYGVTAAAPEDLLAQGWNRAFTSPQVTENQLEMVSVNGAIKVAPATTLSGVAYYRHFKQTHLDGNIADAEPCDPPNGFLCDDDGIIDTNKGPATDPGGPVGSIDSTSQNADSFGVSLQAVNKDKLFGHGNQFLIGTSYDRGHVIYGAQSELGTFLPHFVVQGDGEIVTSGDSAARNLTTTNDYVGVYFSDTFDVTKEFSITAGGRWNYAQVAIANPSDPTDTDLNSTNTYTRFNPAIGATYKFGNGVSAYGGYSEANRAPTPGELACADPEEPCLIESFLTADPPLKQVVSHTWELGLRGDHGARNDHFEWSAGLFRTFNTDDIVTQIAPGGTRGFFVNATDTLRQGVEASAQYSTDRYRLYANYNYTDATYRKGYEQFSPNNPNAGPCVTVVDPDEECIEVRPGDRIAGIPAHKFKAGFDYWLTHKWKFGADLIATSGQYFYGDENNSNPQLAGYAKVNLHTSYDVTENIQIYGLIDNLFDKHFGTYGVFYDTDDAEEASLGTLTSTNSRSITPSQPFAAYGGVKIKFN